MRRSESRSIFRMRINSGTRAFGSMTLSFFRPKIPAWAGAISRARTSNRSSQRFNMDQSPLLGGRHGRQAIPDPVPIHCIDQPAGARAGKIRKAGNAWSLYSASALQSLLSLSFHEADRDRYLGTDPAE